MPADDAPYGKTNKRIIFTDNDHRHAQLINRLRYDNLTQAQFFRLILGGYINGDSRIQDFIDEFKIQSKKKKTKSKRLKKQGRKNMSDMGFDEESIENMFDLIAQEHPDL